MTDTPEPLPDHLVLLALGLCLILTFALVYHVRPSSWYFERQPTPDPTPASVVQFLGRGESSPDIAFGAGFMVGTEG
ncbi:MAG: hypothetical protein TQ37_04970 [Candidatus Synechococcus spongiarum 15L]|uniref:Uncharacterized protein n=1 Tax=Candidatus Synechococcus spongiarum 15L TaxID=1608419 RepID=A0A0G8AVC1_9SYNE|nr:MAG: hypothetical protein TQ37_04970 [Candidatus Synechococcus spongiarum 15L]MCY4359982.1 hypothetical protein [Cyanobacteria bacterium MAG APA_bin_95]OOV35895.1 hypothetical protein BO98_02645 [Candidatus Synechococcus spongiarum LMB bulk10D]